MHRFRKRSESARNGQSLYDSPSQDSSQSEIEVTEQEEEPQFALPSDFRTSLILPDLSRRFSLLRSTTGAPVVLDALRTKLAQQRERGAENQVTEEEEEMILSSFRFRSKTSNTPPQQSTEKLGPVTEDGSLRQSIQSTTTADSSQTSLYPSSITSSPNSSVRKGSKRYSNNLFGSGRLRDYSYLKSATKNGGSRTQSVQSLTPSESSNQATMSSTADSVFAPTPEPTSIPASAETSPSPPDLTPPAIAGENGEHVVSVAEYRISKSLGAAALKRASLALQQAIQEIEEADDEILLPRRSTPIPRTSLEQRASTPERKPTLSTASDYDAPMAISPEKHPQGAEMTDRRASPVSSRILPGYVPGMPRPMTPRDLDPEDLRSHSTTPRATSPTSATFVDASGPSVPTSSPNRARSGSTNSQVGYKSPSSPLFLQRSTNGRFTPEDGRRPASPLSGTAYQSMSVNSRPSTPSNITWTVPPISKSLRNQGGHSRNNSVASDGGGGVAIESHGRHTPGARSLRSPALPDSPMIDRIDSELSTSSTASSTTREDHYRPESKVSLMELGSPMRAQRSPTPTQSAPRSPTSSSFARSAGERPSVQASAAPSTLFNLGPISPSIFSPLSNPSRTSLESEGSSYHSLGEEEKDRSYRLISDLSESKPTWDDLPKSDWQLSTSDDSTDEEWDPEDYIAKYAGLKRSDFIAIQDKLVTAFKDRVERAPSAMRRRRPSTSQSNYSQKDLQALQNTGPLPPQVQTPSSPTSATPVITTTAPESTNAPASPDRPEYPPASPGTLRNRELAKALFGHSPGSQEALSQLVPPSPSDLQAIPINGRTASETSEEPRSPVVYEQPSHNVSSPKVVQPSEEEARLAAVQQRMQAATMALKSPTSPNPSPMHPSGTVSKKRIDPNLISNPRLVSASTSVDAVPIQRSPSLSSAQASGTSKIGSRFKKLRGTLRAKNSPVAEDGGSHSPNESRAGSRAAQYEHESSTTVSSRPSVASPPASAGPGLKGFMARLRGKQRTANDQLAPSDARLSPLPTRSASVRVAPPSQQRVPVTPNSANTEADVFLSPNPRPVTPQIQSAPPFQTSYPVAASIPPQAQDSNDPLKQLWEAAEKIGIEPGELNALLARSNSTTSRLPTRSDSLRRPQTPVAVDASQLTPTVDQQTFRAETPDYRSNGNGTGTDSDATARAEKRSSRQASRKAPDNLRLPREGSGNKAASTIIRRTIIFPDSKMTPDELAALMGKSPIGRKRESVTSTASRSIRDRAPTPPPPRSPTAKRFSHQSPPVPSLPPALGGPPAFAAGPLEKSTSNSDSLYDMYSGENRPPSTLPPHESEGPLSSETGAGVELIQLANGETIWNIVNGLRDDDDDYYNNRASFASEYSQAGTNEGGLQVFVKEKGHARSTSRGSQSSFISRAKSGKRPETKVFYSPTANIGRLIEDLSQRMDAGSFNFLPTRPPHGHSPSSSMSTNELNYHIEERLDEMIHTVRSS